MKYFQQIVFIIFIIISSCKPISWAERSNLIKKNTYFSRVISGKTYRISPISDYYEYYFIGIDSLVVINCECTQQRIIRPKPENYNKEKYNEVLQLLFDNCELKSLKTKKELFVEYKENGIIQSKVDSVVSEKIKSHTYVSSFFGEEDIDEINYDDVSYEKIKYWRKIVNSKIRLLQEYKDGVVLPLQGGVRRVRR